MKHQRSAYVSLRFHLGVPFSTSGGARSALVAFWLKGRGGEELASFDGSDLYAPSALLYARPDRIHRRLGVGFALLESGCRARKPDDFGLDVFWAPHPLKPDGGVGFPITLPSQVLWAEKFRFWMLYLPMWRPGNFVCGM